MLRLLLLLVSFAQASGQGNPCTIDEKVYQPGERYPTDGCKMVKCGDTSDVQQGCTSQLDNSKCVDLNGIEEMDCVTYTCTEDAGLGHPVLKKDEQQEARCSINGKCFTVGEGPNLCTVCQKNNDGTVGVLPGCQKEDGTCAAEGSEIQVGCDIRVCTVRNNVVDFHRTATLGCMDNCKCYGEGSKVFHITCNECVRDPKTGFHAWYRECRDCRNNQCFKEFEVNDFSCTTFVCHNRGGIGWYYSDVPKCQVGTKDCVAFNTTSMRNGFCYHCTDKEGGPPEVACQACGKCLLPGESATCDGKDHTCDKVPTVPPEGEVRCKVNSVEFKEGETKEIYCNKYMCTRFGVLRLTNKCKYSGKCYRRGVIIDPNKCLMCSESGTGCRVTSGCMFNGKCYKEGVAIRINCKIKVCKRQGNYMVFVNGPDQPTPCQSFGSCYPVGPFQYAHARVCATCKADGTIEYACKLSNGDCLDIGQEESNPSLGCYRMKCTYTEETRTLSIAKAPGQPLICTLPDKTCLEENKNKTIDGRNYYCSKGEHCMVGDQRVNVGDSITRSCHDIECQQSLVNGVKVYKTFIKTHKCPYGDDCRGVGEVFDINCDIYKCTLDQPDKYAKSVKEKDRCSIDGHCIDVGQNNTNNNCVTRGCDADGQVVVREVGCRSKLSGVCMSPGQTLETDGTKEICSDSGSVTGGGGTGDGTIRPCLINNMELHYGQTTELYCNTYKCEIKENIKKAYLQGQAKCAVKTATGTECFDAGTTKYCIKCLYDGNRISMEQSCIGDGGQCVTPGQTADYKCGKAICNPDTMRMDVTQKNACHYQDLCIPTDDYVDLPYQGTVLKCTCKNVANNDIKCIQGY